MKFLQLGDRKMWHSRHQPLFMVSTEQGEVRLVKDVRKAWEEMGLPGRPDIMAIRTAVCTYVS